MSARYENIDQTLRRARTALRANEAVVALGVLAAAVAGVALVSYVLVLFDVSVGAVRPWFLGVASLAVLGAVAYGARPFLRPWTDDALARRIGDHDPNVADGLLSAVQLHRDKEKLSTEYALSRELIELHVDRTAEQAASVDTSALPDRRATAQLLGAGLGSLAVALALAVVFPGLAARAKTLFLGLPPGEKTPIAAAIPGAAPRLGDVTVTYHYPDYSGRDPQTFEGTDGNLKALKGTVASITLKADRPVKTAQITLNGKEPLKLDVTTSPETGGTTLAGELSLLENGSWTVEATSANGTPVADRSTRTITVEEDRAPEVTIVWPVEQVTEVNELEDVTVTWGAEDDYGLKSAELVWENHPPVDVKKPAPKKGGKPVSGKIALASFPHEFPLRHGDQYKWSLASLSLEPGGYVEYYVEATDNDTVSGPKKGRSAHHILRLLSSSEIHEKAIALQEAILKRMIHLLGDHLEYDPKSATREKLADDAERFEGKARELSQALDVVQNEMLKDPLGDEVVYRQILKIRADVQNVMVSYSARVLESAARSSADPAQGRREAFLSARAEAIPLLEKDILFLDRLIGKQRFDGARQELASLANEQKDLRKMLDDYKKGGMKDSDLAKALEQKLASLQKKMQEVAQKMASTMESMKSDFDNSAMQDDIMTQIQKAIDEGRMDDAAALTEKMLKGLDDMVAQMDQVEQQFNLDPETAKRLGDAQKELGKLADEQKKLAEDTSRVRDQIQKRADESGKKIDDFVKKEQEKVRKLREQLDALQRQAMLDPAMRSLVAPARFGLERELQALEGGLKSGELGESLEHAENIDNELEGLERAPETLGMNRPGDQPDPKTLDAASKAKMQAKSIVKDLEQLRQQFEENASPEEKQKLSQLGSQQQKLQQRAQGLAQEMNQLAEKTPFVPGEAGQQIAGASESMGEAQGKLKGGNAAGSVPPQRQASEKLGQAQAQLQGSGQSQRGGQGMPLASRMGQRPNGSEGNRGFSNEKVEIPDGSQFRVPKEFREDILEAMKKPSPDGYKQLNQEYYERLIK